MDHFYLCIDLKCFYASVECADHGWDPFKKLMVVADPLRGPKTICLAVSPAMKELGVQSRSRVFQIPRYIKYEKVCPRMKRYMEVSAQIYALYLRCFSPQDIHVYSIDECFIDVAPYLSLYHKTPYELSCELMNLVLKETGICATTGMGPNLFLAKVALDVTAKHVPSHIGYLDQDSFKIQMWHYQPITDIWGIGPGTAETLSKMDIYDLAGIVLADERTLYKKFGINAELLIDHAWGIEPCTIAEIKAYRPKAHSLSNGQVLIDNYTSDEARIVLREMVDASILDLIDRGLACGHIGLFIGYSASQNIDGTLARTGKPWGRRYVLQDVPHTRGSRKLDVSTNSRTTLIDDFLQLYDQIIDHECLVKRINLSMGELIPEEFATLTLFSDPDAQQAERRLSKATLVVKQKFGKNALLYGTSFKNKATARERNMQIGGHHA